MRRRSAGLFAFVMAVAASWPLTLCAQSTLTITFDGPPLPREGQRAIPIENYSESGLTFRQPETSLGIIHASANQTPDFPYNGTPYIQGYNFFDHFISWNFTNFSSFGMSSIEVAGFGGGYSNWHVRFTGTLAVSGFVIETNFSGTGLEFQKLHFGPEWSSGLRQGTVTANLASLDNLVILIPEPAAVLLSFTGGLVSYWGMKRRHKP